MQPRIQVITLAVDDLDRAVEFYRDGLGLQTPGVIGTEFVGDDTNPSGAVAMFQLQGGLILAMWPRTRSVADRATARPSLGHLLGLFPRPRRPPLGDPVEPRPRP